MIDAFHLVRFLVFLLFYVIRFDERIDEYSCEYLWIFFSFFLAIAPARNDSFYFQISFHFNATIDPQKIKKKLKKNRIKKTDIFFLNKFFSISFRFPSQPAEPDLRDRESRSE